MGIIKEDLGLISGGGKGSVEYGTFSDGNNLKEIDCGFVPDFISLRTTGSTSHAVYDSRLDTDQFLWSGSSSGPTTRSMDIPSTLANGPNLDLATKSVDGYDGFKFKTGNGNWYEIDWVAVKFDE